MPTLPQPDAATAAQTLSGLEESPIDAFIHNRIEQLIQHIELPENVNRPILELVWEAYTRGMQDGNLRIGELI